MQLKITTDYAIRCVMHLAENNKKVSAQEINDELNVPKHYAQQILGALKRAGIVESELGIGGGYYLAKPADQISMLEIMELFETTMQINRCLEEDCFCSRNGVEKGCRINKVYQRTQEEIEKVFSETKISDLLE